MTANTPKTTTEYAIGIDVGGTRTKCVAVDRAARILRREALPTGDKAEAWKQHVPAFVAACEAELGTPAGVGIACPGIAAADGTTVFWMIGRMDAVQGFDFASLAPGRRVRVANDAQAALLGERWAGAAKGTDNAILLTLGTGVGGAAVVDGRLLRGHLGRAGHLGHVALDVTGRKDICNTPGSLEELFGDYSVPHRTGDRFPDSAALVQAVRAGDPFAADVWHKSVRALAAAIASLCNVLDPEVVVIGGGVAKAGPTLFDPLTTYMTDFEWRPHGRQVRITPATLGDDAGPLGAAAWALQPQT